MKALHGALALSLAALTGTAALLATSAPLAAQPGTDVNGRNVIHVTFNGGHYAKVANGTWGEFDARGQLAFRFVEVQRDDWSVYLNDPSRNVQIQLDLFRKKVSYGTNNGSRSDLYDITGARRTAVAATAPAQRSRLVNAGPIWDQRDAELKCPVAAHAVGGRWTGQWSTVRQGQMSVCQIAY